VVGVLLSEDQEQWAPFQQLEQFCKEAQQLIFHPWVISLEVLPLALIAVAAVAALDLLAVAAVATAVSEAQRGVTAILVMMALSVHLGQVVRQMAALVLHQYMAAAVAAAVALLFTIEVCNEKSPY
jgi:4-amino-4-deoxy-L-arabinose transferase-like glycosyltransferase